MSTDNLPKKQAAHLSIFEAWVEENYERIENEEAERVVRQSRDESGRDLLILLAEGMLNKAKPEIEAIRPYVPPENDVGLFSQAWVDKVEMLLENVKRGTAS